MSAVVGERTPARLRSACGREIPLHVDRWFGEPALEERTVLRAAIGPVLDVGCGPGRHVAALCARGVSAVGLDEAPSAIAHARRRGIPAVLGSIFEPVPAEGRWGTVLLLDGNVGIGGDPARLLGRIRDVLAPGGRALVEAEPPGLGTGTLRVRAEIDDRPASRWFPWALVGADEVPALAARASFSAIEVRERAGRWFARLEAR